MNRRLAALLLAVAAIAVGAAAFVILSRPIQEIQREEEKKSIVEPGEPVFLSDLHWVTASTGWVALADDNLPKLDTSFLNSPLSMGGESYGKGLGVFPLSEITYDLAGNYGQFLAEVGLDDAVPTGKGSVIFKLFVDDVQAYTSNLVRSGDSPVHVQLPLGGAGRLKLVVEDSGDGSSLDYANWADARLLPATQGDLQFLSFKHDLDMRREERKSDRARDWDVVKKRSEAELTAIFEAFEGALPGPETRAVFNAHKGLAVIANDKLALTLGYGGERHGLLSISSLESQSMVALDTTASVQTADQRTVILSDHTSSLGSEGVRSSRVEDPALGLGTELEVDFPVLEGPGTITSRITLFDASSYLTYRLELAGAEEGQSIRSISYFSFGGQGRFVLGEDAGYLTDYSLIRRAEVRDDSILRKELVGLGKPVLLYDRGRAQRIVMALLDEMTYPASFSTRLETGKVCAQVGFEYSVPDDQRRTQMLSSPRLFLQPSFRGGIREVTQGYRAVMAARYQQPPIPDWVKYQWGTWYAFGMNYDEEIVREQIDYIARNLADLGPWSVLLDAGWYVAEGRSDSTWKVDEDKFPNGLRALVDYAHSKDIKVVLYFSAPYLDDREREGNWLGLRGFIEEHPDWLIKLEADNTGSSYVYDFTNPELVEYMRNLIASFFWDYDVDGIKIDGLGQAEGEQLSVEERDVFGDVNKIRMFTMDIYRLIYEEAMKAGKEVYIESGWAIPAYANQYAHTFRYADEFPAIEYRYPAPGLLEHVDYASIQKRVLGQRANMGMVWGGPESQEMIRQWFEAALAMGVQMTVSTDLTRLSARDLSAFRSVLAHYNAFQGETSFVGVPVPSSFATTVGEVTYLGAVNRDTETARVPLKLSDHGLSEGIDYLLYDVTNGNYSRVRGSFQASVPGPGFRLYLLRNTPGVVWSNSSLAVDSDHDQMTISATGPRGIAGLIQIYAPEFSSVWLDGKELPRAGNPRSNEGYSYDASTGVLRLRYRHDRPHTIEVRF